MLCGCISHASDWINNLTLIEKSLLYFRPDQPTVVLSCTYINIYLFSDINIQKMSIFHKIHLLPQQGIQIFHSILDVKINNSCRYERWAILEDYSLICFLALLGWLSIDHSYVNAFLFVENSIYPLPLLSSLLPLSILSPLHLSTGTSGMGMGMLTHPKNASQANLSDCAHNTNRLEIDDSENSPIWCECRKQKHLPGHNAVLVAS